MLRYYLPITNHCNRACEYCCVYSSPAKKTFMSFEWIKEFFDKINAPYEIQLEGGEPTIHPRYDNIFNYFYDSPNCVKIVLTTNGTSFSKISNLREYFEHYNKKEFIIKPSINEYLIKKDPKLLDTYETLVDSVKVFKNIQIIFNVRRRKGVQNDDQWLVDELEKRNLLSISNIFFFQRYGLAKDMEEYDEPFIICNPVDFHLMTPDGKDFGMDMIARSEYMKGLE